MHDDEPETITLKNRFLTIATAKVATSGFEGYEIGMLRKGTDEVVINQSRRIAEAKRSVIEISKAVISCRYNEKISGCWAGRRLAHYMQVSTECGAQDMQRITMRW